MNTELDKIFQKESTSQNISTDKEDLDSNLETSVLLAKSFVPYSHRRIADNYATMRKIYPFLIVQPNITTVERALLLKYNLNTLENTSITAANKEIQLLKEWATSTEDIVREDAVNLLTIRIKEMKHIMSNNYTIRSNEILNGYKAVETYLINIPKYYR